MDQETALSPPTSMTKQSGQNRRATRNS